MCKGTCIEWVVYGSVVVGGHAELEWVAHGSVVVGGHGENSMGSIWKHCSWWP